ncbi:MAG: TonB-dependent receptor [Vicinamibacterales bacterium]
MRSIVVSSLRVLFAAAALSYPASALAQPSTQAIPRFDQQVFVTASRVESTVARIPGLVTVIDAETLAEMPAQDIPEALRQLGLHVIDLTGARRSFRVDLRGFGATAGLNTLVLVDGRRVNQPDLSGSDWAQIPLHRVARIEVVRTSGAVSFGDNAGGGVINIITKSDNARATRFALSGGGFGTVTGEGSTRGSRGSLTYAVNGRGHRSDGHRENAQTSGGDFGGEIVVRPDSRFEVAVSGGYHGDRTGLPGSLKESDLAAGVDREQSLTPDDFADIDDGYVMASPRLTLGDRGYVVADVSVRQRDSRFFSSFSGGEFTGDTGISTIAASPRASLDVSTGAIAHSLVLGADFTSATEDITNTSVFDGFPSVGVFELKKSNSAAYLRDEVSFSRGSLSGGYRFDSAEYHFEPSVPSSKSFDAHAADLGATMVVAPQASVFASVSRSFRYPVLDEMFDFFSNTINGSLEPQRSTGVEGGVRFELGIAQATVSAFRLATSDEIFFNPVGGPFGFGANENLDGDSLRSGIEMALAAQAGRIHLGATVAVVDTSIDGGIYDGQSMPGVPTRRASIEARAPFGERFEAGLAGTFTGNRRFEGDFAGTFGEQDGFFLMDARLAYTLGRARIRLDVKNLFDEEYNDFGVLGGFPVQRAFYPSPGIHALAGVELTF